MNDEAALALIRGILNHLEDDDILESNGEALERAFAKPEGFVSDLIFQDDVSDENVILETLKQDTAIRL